MRRFLPVLILLLMSCSDHQPDISNSKGTQYIADSTKHRLLKIINGGWVNAGYIDSFERYHSPSFANRQISVLQLIFDTARVNGDTMYNGFHRDSYTASEQFDIVFSNVNGNVKMIPRPYPSINYRIDELRYRIEGSDTSLILVTADTEYTFRRVFHEFPEYGKVKLTALDVFVDRELSSFEWMNGKNSIFFRKDGRVEGFENYSRYSVKTKAEYPESETDEITLYNDTIGTTMAFKWISGWSNGPIVSPIDVLQLYELKDSGNSMELSRGKLLYEMNGFYISHRYY